MTLEMKEIRESNGDITVKVSIDACLKPCCLETAKVASRLTWERSLEFIQARIEATANKIYARKRHLSGLRKLTQRNRMKGKASSKYAAAKAAKARRRKAWPS